MMPKQATYVFSLLLLHSLLSACIRSRQTYHPYEISLNCAGLKRSHKIHMSIEKWKIYWMCVLCCVYTSIQCKHELEKENQKAGHTFSLACSLFRSSSPTIASLYLTVCVYIKNIFSRILFIAVDTVKLYNNCQYVRWKKYCKAQRENVYGWRYPTVWRFDGIL